MGLKPRLDTWQFQSQEFIIRNQIKRRKTPIIDMLVVAISSKKSVGIICVVNNVFII